MEESLVPFIQLLLAFHMSTSQRGNPDVNGLLTPAFCRPGRVEFPNAGGRARRPRAGWRHILRGEQMARPRLACGNLLQTEPDRVPVLLSRHFMSMFVTVRILVCVPRRCAALACWPSASRWRCGASSRASTRRRRSRRCHCFGGTDPASGRM